MISNLCQRSAGTGSVAANTKIVPRGEGRVDYLGQEKRPVCFTSGDVVCPS